ncbi:XRE family transcriptional regulator [Cypionkella aquatica]|uniref:XRE family transcriptional regulator n=1 Tax=Cypionkella aquatica TaxID=1756042 RepID=A0AA37U8F9_9RHOB|nr:helix-turn-helix transcriptional regulator [Cypionkella aquatica]GLS87191.1 XRE family transcriptional regulator [Cypionkella aquatica]
MPISALTGSRLRERRVALGLRQADLAETVGISASYLNLIEHNRRRIGDALLARLAQALGQPVEAFQEGIAAAVLDDLRAAAGRLPGAEIDRSEDFAGRFPGWAATVIGLHQRVAGLERALEAMSDRMSQDPHLSASLHEVLSAVASVRSTAAILAETQDIEPEWQARFLGNLQDDSKRLALGAEALVRYLDTAGQAEEQGLASPQEELEAWLASTDWQGADTRGLVSAAARHMADQWRAQAARDLAAYPAAGFAAVVAESGSDPVAVAARFGGDVLAAFRRIALQPGLQAGLVVCDASGTLTFRKPLAGFGLPRFGAACPLWPLFAALSRPMTPIEMVVETAGPVPARFRVRAFCQPRFPQGSRGPELREAAMLILPEQGRAGEALPIGSTCRICQRHACAARREPSILQG